MVKYIICDCGKRYQEGNKKHFDTIDHKNYIKSKNINESNELCLIVYDIDKNKLIEFLKNNCDKKKKFGITEDDIIEDDKDDKDYNPSSDDDDDDDNDEGDEAELSES